jgi:hypothetical protein
MQSASCQGVDCNITSPATPHFSSIVGFQDPVDLFEYTTKPQYPMKRGGKYTTTTASRLIQSSFLLLTKAKIGLRMLGSSPGSLNESM